MPSISSLTGSTRGKNKFKDVLQQQQKKNIVKKKWKRFKKIEPINWKKNHESYAPWEFKKGGGERWEEGSDGHMVWRW